MSVYGFWARFCGGPADGRVLRVFHDPAFANESEYVPPRPARYQDIVRPLLNRFGAPTGIEVISRYRLAEEFHSEWTYRLISTEQSLVDI